MYYSIVATFFWYNTLIPKNCGENFIEDIFLVSTL